MFCERRKPPCVNRSFISGALSPTRCVNTLRSNWPSRYGHGEGAVRKNCGDWVGCCVIEPWKHSCESLYLWSGRRKIQQDCESLVDRASSLLCAKAAAMLERQS